MSRVLRSLQGKLVLTLIVLLLANSAFFVAMALMSTRYHLQAVEQSLNQDLAKRILSEMWLVGDGITGNSGATTFDRIMRLNPDLEVYRTDSAGHILDYSAPAGRVLRDRVSTEPIEAFLLETRPFPILGDDPRSLAGKKVFSVAAIKRNGIRDGYLYIVLGGEAYDTVMRMLRGNYILRLSLGITAGSVFLTVLIGVACFYLLTKRLRSIAHEMCAFRESGFRRSAVEVAWQSARFRDELDEIGQTFREMCNCIRDQFKMLEAADQYRRDMIADISHDLRTPLATLRGYLETLLMKEAELSDAVRRRYIEHSLDFGERISRLIMELLELSMLDTPDLTLNTEQFSVAELAQDVAEKWNLEAERKGIRFISEIVPDIPFVLGDIRLIERVLEKLLENTMRFTPAGGTVRLTVEGGKDFVIARLEDTGPGIAEKDLSRVFDRFYRAESERIEPGEGAGLGLAIARRIIELHGGTIGAEPLERGVSFFFTLPAVQA